MTRERRREGSMLRAALPAVLLAGVLLFSACGRAQDSAGQSDTAGQKQAAAAEGEALHMFVSIQPQKYFVRRIAGPDAQITVMVPPGKEPHSYEPTPQQVSRLSEADVYFRIRVPFEEAFIPRIRRSLEELAVVDITADVERRNLASRERNGEPGAEDPHVWLGPQQVKTMAQEIRDTLTELHPEEAESYRSNYREFTADIDALHRQLTEELAPLKGETLFVFHPAFGYFADSYGLQQKAVELGGHEPSAKELERIIAEAKEEGVRVIFVQPQFARDSAERIAAAIDGAVVPIDPLAEDWMDNMRTIAERIEEGLQQHE